jgi:subtilase family serine protease
VLDGADVVLGSRIVPALGSYGESTATTTLTMPAGLGGGPYYVIAKADADGAVPEVNEDNNVAVSAAMTIGADFTVSLDVPAAAFQTAPGGTFNVTDVTRNGRPVPAPASVTRFHLSTDTVLDASDLVLASRAVPALEAYGDSVGVTPLTLPAGLGGGTYYVIARADADGAVAETDETNNVFVFNQPLNVGADLIVFLDLAGASSNVAAGATITVADYTRNEGAAPAGAFTLMFYLSGDTVLDAGDTMIGSRSIPSLAAGAQSTGTNQLTLPTGIAGIYYVLAQADATGAVSERNEANNVTATTAIEVGPDLTITGVTAPPRIGAGATVYMSDTTKNRGAGSAAGTTTRIYLSADEMLDSGDVLLGARTVQTLTPGAYQSGTTTVVIPALDAGRYWVIVVADGLGNVAETNESNNTWVHALDVLPDFSVPTVTAPSKAYPGSTITVGDITVNSGAGAPASATGTFLSADTVLGEGDLLLAVRNVPAMSPGTTSSGEVPVTVPIELGAGTYYLIAVADVEGLVAEVNEGNNTRYKSLTIAPDLIVAQLTAPGSAAAGATIVVDDATRNLGSPAVATTTRFYLSADTALGTDDTFLGSRAVPSLAVGEAHTAATSLTIPASTTPGTYYVIAQSDGHAIVVELVETNNLKTRAISITP